jgi:predicted nucleotidyltransferase
MIEDAKYLNDNEKTALVEIKRRVSALFDVRKYILFGSKARGDAMPDSDIDILIITGKELEHSERHRISNEIFEVNLKFDTMFSFITIDVNAWDSKLYSFYPLHVNVVREGVPV